ncbi:MAG: hypothetical protein ACREMX_05995 [Gemmatimonadales bacterium]
MRPPTIRLFRRATAGALAAGAVGLVGCSQATPPPPTPGPAEAVDACIVGGGGTADPDTLFVAPDSLLIRPDHETLIRLDCQGNVRPALASGWSSDSAGRSWTFVLGNDPGSSDTAAVRAADVASTWRSSQVAASTLRWAGIESVTALDDRRLVVGLRDPHDSVPELFADPTLAVSRDAPGPVLAPAPGAGRDPRDALDRGADLLRTDDPEIVEYARRRPDFVTVPLPWSRTYVLLLPAGSEGLDATVGSDSAGFRAALARDAVAGEARGAEPPFWWNEPPSCQTAASPSTGATGRAGATIAYPRDDRIARGLAERIVALAKVPGTSALGLGSGELSTSLRAGSARAFVVPLPRRSLLPCRDSAGWPPGASVVPLVDARSTLILRRDHPALAVDWDGTVRLGKTP